MACQRREPSNPQCAPLFAADLSQNHQMRLLALMLSFCLTVVQFVPNSSYHQLIQVACKRTGSNTNKTKRYLTTNVLIVGSLSIYHIYPSRLSISSIIYLILLIYLIYLILPLLRHLSHLLIYLHHLIYLVSQSLNSISSVSSREKERC